MREWRALIRQYNCISPNFIISSMKWKSFGVTSPTSFFIHTHNYLHRQFIASFFELYSIIIRSKKFRGYVNKLMRVGGTNSNTDIWIITTINISYLWRKVLLALWFIRDEMDRWGSPGFRFDLRKRRMSTWNVHLLNVKSSVAAQQKPIISVLKERKPHVACMHYVCRIFDTLFVSHAPFSKKMENVKFKAIALWPSLQTHPKSGSL